MLRRCSLVAKSWAHPSRRLLFETINVSGTVRLGSWLRRISPTNTGMLLQHVRSLTCCVAEVPTLSLGPVNFLRDHSSSLRQLERLTLYSGRPLSFARTETYSAFQQSLSYLHLRSFSVTANAVVTLVNYFPNLAHLHLERLSHEVDDQPIPPFSRPLQELTVTEFENITLLDQLKGLQPRCEKITIEQTWRSWRPCQSVAQCVINGMEAGIKHLDIRSDLRGMSNISKILQRGWLKVTPGFRYSLGKRFDTLKLPRAPRTRDLRVAPGAIGVGPHFVHHFYKDSKDNIHQNPASKGTSGIP